VRRFNTIAVCGWRAALAGCGLATTLLDFFLIPSLVVGQFARQHDVALSQLLSEMKPLLHPTNERRKIKVGRDVSRRWYDCRMLG